MKTILKKILFIVVLFAFGCNNNKKNNYQFLQGNWYFSIRDNYAELFVNSEHFYYYFNNGGRMNFRYFLKDDSVILTSEAEVTKAVFDIINDDMFVLTFKDQRGKRKDTLYRIKSNGYTLDKYLKEKDYQKYKDAFYNRLRNKGFKTLP